MLPCGIEHGSVVVPCDTRLDPALTADEARRLLNYPVYFFILRWDWWHSRRLTRSLPRD
ncbi:MAG: hypothetical protein R3F31_18425 [Verrucomicrobiales bacterium]